MEFRIRSQTLSFLIVILLLILSLDHLFSSSTIIKKSAHLPWHSAGVSGFVSLCSIGHIQDEQKDLGLLFYKVLQECEYFFKRDTFTDRITYICYIHTYYKYKAIPLMYNERKAVILDM